MRSLLVAILALPSLSVSSISLAQTPDSLSFQGVLTDQNGVLVADGNYNLLIKMYKGSSKIWEQSLVGALGMRGLYAVHADDGDNTSYTVVGGAANNVVGAAIVGATIGGGGGIRLGTSLPTAYSAISGRLTEAFRIRPVPRPRWGGAAVTRPAASAARFQEGQTTASAVGIVSPPGTARGRTITVRSRGKI